MGRWLLGLVAVAAVVVGIVVGALNPDPLTLDLAVIRWTASAGSIVVVATATGFLAGMAIAALAFLVRRRPRRRGPEGSASRPDA